MGLDEFTRNYLKGGGRWVRDEPRVIIRWGDYFLFRHANKDGETEYARLMRPQVEASAKLAPFKVCVAVMVEAAREGMYDAFKRCRRAEPSDQTHAGEAYRVYEKSANKGHMPFKDFVPRMVQSMPTEPQRSVAAKVLLDLRKQGFIIGFRVMRDQVNQYLEEVNVDDELIDGEPLTHAAIEEWLKQQGIADDT